MSRWKKFQGWMAFDHLDENAGLARAFTICYRITDDSSDVWTDRINRFKNKQCLALRCGTAVISKAVPDLLSGLGLGAASTTFVPALSSSEIVASDSGVLWKMTKYCAQVVKVGFVGDAITKNAHEPLHKTFDSSKRQAILDGANYKSGMIVADNIVIFDDVITRGATMSHIARAILEENSAVKIYGVALGKAERRQYWKQYDEDISNDHVPQVWDRIWGSYDTE